MLQAIIAGPLGAILIRPLHLKQLNARTVLQLQHPDRFHLGAWSKTQRVLLGALINLLANRDGLIEQLCTQGGTEEGGCLLDVRYGNADMVHTANSRFTHDRSRCLVVMNSQ